MASAFGAVRGLWPDPDVLDQAQITSVELTTRVPLTRYADSSRSRLQLSSGVVEATPALRAFRDDETSTTPTSPSPTSTSPTPTPTLTTTSPLPTPTPTPGPDLRVWKQDVVSQVRLTAPQYVLPADSRELPPEWFLFVQQEPTDENGQLATPADAAERLVGLLGETRMLDRTDGQKEALGVVIDANVRVDGMQGEKLWVLWQLAGDAEGQDPVWSDEVPAARIEAEKYSDGALVRFWVPMPQQPGHYAVEVLVEDREGNKLDAKKSEYFD